MVTALLAAFRAGPCHSAVCTGLVCLAPDVPLLAEYSTLYHAGAVTCLNSQIFLFDLRGRTEVAVDRR